MSENESFEESAALPAEEIGFVTGHDLSRAEKAEEALRALQAAEKLDPEGGGGFNPRIEPTESTPALAAEERFPRISSKMPSFSAATLAPEGDGSQPYAPSFPPVTYSDPFTPAPPPQRPLFQSFNQPEVVAPDRIPHIGHLAVFGVLTFAGLLGTSGLTWIALHFHLFGVSTLQQATDEIHYNLGSMAALYLLTLAACVLVFPPIWHKSFFAGLQWNAAIALRLRWRMFGAAGLCLVLALVDEVLMPGPTNAPIDKMFQTPGAAWLMFAFGVTCAPLFEEIVFRGFLLPVLATTWDWTVELRTGSPALPLDAHGGPQWSLPAMVAASIVTSIPFALMHAEQTAHAMGPFVLLVAVSLVLCWARLGTRSLAASVLVHASYNFLLFSLMLLGTGGFRHLDKM